MKAARTRWFLLCAIPLLSSCIGSFGLNADITVSGQVEDEDGAPVENVRLDVSQGRADLTSESFTSYSDSTELLENGQFQVGCSNCSSLQLHLSKPGFHTETRSFRVAEPEATEGSRTASAAEDVERLNLRVVLRSSANAVQLVRYRHQLQSSATEVIRVAPLRRDLGTRGASLDQLDKTPSATAQPLPGYVQLQLDDALKTIVGETSTQLTTSGPVRAVVDFSEANGGVVLHEFASGDSGTVYRDMLTAPAEGYQSELVLNTEDGYGGYFFYCRIGNQYGKGRVNRPELSIRDGEFTVVTSIELRMNPDGSRNVETIR